MHAIKEKELDLQSQIQYKEAQMEIDKIKQEAIQQVEIKRNRLKAKLAEMRKKAKKDQDKIKQQLQTTRIQTAQMMSDKYKVGNQTKCELGLQNEENWIAYCTANLSYDISKFSACRDPDEFCGTCCDNEFGEMKLDLRFKCNREVCDKNKNKNSNSNIQDASGNTEIGNWIFQSKQLV